MTPPDEGIEKASRLLRAAQSALFITGAGVSAESGMPTYRGIGGLYDRDLTREGIPIEEALSGGMLRSRPEICWKYIHQIEAACRGARPNRAHEIIAGLDARLERCVVLTQNVDGLHSRAGSRDVIEMHGNVHTLLCVDCDHREQVEDYANVPPVPSCPDCGSLVRPEVVLFGEMLPTAALGRLEQELNRGFDIVFSIGTTSVFPYIAGPVLLARRQGKPTIEINPDRSEVSDVVDIRLQSAAGEALEAIVRCRDKL